MELVWSCYLTTGSLSASYPNSMGQAEVLKAHLPKGGEKEELDKRGDPESAHSGAGLRGRRENKWSNVEWTVRV